MLRTEMQEWIVRIVISNQLARISSGWNSFARESQLTLNEEVVFTMREGEDMTVFDVTFPQRG